MTLRSRTVRAVDVASVVIAALTLAALCPTSAAAQTPAVSLAPGFQSRVLGPHITYLVDEAGTLSPATLDAHASERFMPSDKEVPSFGFSPATYWFRIHVDNPTNHPRTWLLEMAYPHLDHLDLYGPDEGQPARHWASGDRLPFASRDIDYRHVVFEIDTPPGAHTYYLSAKSSGPLTVPLTAWSARGFLEHVQRESTVLWGFYGLMLVMAIYNLFVFFAVRRLPYLYYFLYITAFVLFQFTLNGLSYQYLWPNAPDWTNRFSPMSIGLAFAMGVQFMRHFLDLRSHLPRIDRLLLVLGPGGGALTVLFALLLPVSLSVRFAIVTGVVVIVIALPTSAWLALKGHREARFYTTAWIIFFVGILLYLLKSLGILPSNAFTEWTIQAGAALEVVLLSLGLADKINVMRRNLAVLNEELESNVVRLTEALDQAEEARRAKSAFLASVSHELRTPLNAIINIPEGLLERFHTIETVHCAACDTSFDLEENETVEADTPCPECGSVGLQRGTRPAFGATAETLEESLRLVHRTGRHMLSVVSDILDISKLEAGKMVVHPVPMDLVELVREVVAPLALVAQSKGVSLSLALCETPRIVLGDGTKLRQIVLNLVSNAIKFSDGRGTVRVSMVDQGDDVVIGVHDQGIGIAEGDKPRVFGHFVQASSNDSRKFGGTGLGLAISKQLVELHDGELWFDSQVGRGTDFYLRLRVHRPVGDGQDLST